MKILLKILKYVALSALATILTIGILAYSFQDRVIEKVVKELNFFLASPVTVSKITLDPFSEFPYTSLKLRDVQITESIPGSEQNFVEANEIYLAFSPIKLIQGDITIKRVKIYGGKSIVRFTRQGTPNYQIFKPSSSDSNDSISLAISSIFIIQHQFNYLDEKNRQSYEFFIQDVKGNLKYSNISTNINVNGKLDCNYIKIAEQAYFKNKFLELNGSLSYNNESDILQIFPSRLLINGSKFNVKGDFNIPESSMNLKMKGIKTDIKSLLAFLPSEENGKFDKYSSEGNVYFNTTLTGSFTSPFITTEFGAENAKMRIPGMDVDFTELSFNGFFSNGQRRSQKSSILNLNDLKGLVNGSPISGNLQLRDFTDPLLNFSLQSSGPLTLAELFYENPSYKVNQGEFNLDLQFNGRISDLTNTAKLSSWQTSGELQIRNGNIKIPELTYPVESINGTILFNNEDLALSNFSVKVSSSDATLNGYFKNITGYIFQDKPIVMQSDLQSDFIDVELLLLESDEESEYLFKIKPNIYLDFTCNVNQIRFKRFNGKNLEGKLIVQGQKAIGENIQVQTMGGKITLDGVVDARNPAIIKVDTKSAYEGIQIDSLFYTFYDWNQDFLTHKHLKGRANAYLEAYMEFDSTLELDNSSIEAILSTNVIGGELINFEPMQELSRFAEEEQLAHLTFGEMSNEIAISEETIYLPSMTISSNVSTIEITGKHTFDQEIDYRFKVPIRDLRKSDRDERFGEIEQDGDYGNVFIKMTGTADEFDIAWDKKSTINNVKDNIRSIFKKNEEKQKSLELEESEYIEIGG